MRKLFNQTHRKVYGEKSVQFSILAIGALVFGPIVSGKEISIPLAIVGLVFSIVGLVVSYFLLKDVRGGERQ